MKVSKTDNFDKFDTVHASVDSLSANFKPCKYYEVDKLKSKPNRPMLNIIHVNIRSLQKNFETLQELLCLLPLTPQIICLSETRIFCNSLINIDLPNYKLYHTDSTTRAGGVAIYVLDTIQVQILSNLSLNVNGCEDIWIKLSLSDIIIGVIYRHPPTNNIKQFLDQMNKNLELLNNKIYLIGDFNINIDQSKYPSRIAVDYINMLNSNGLFHLITLPTRVTNTSSTVIDHIITNDSKHSIFPGIIKCDISDHYPVFCSIDINAPPKFSPRISVRRDLQNFDKALFSEELHHILQTFFQSKPEINPNNFNKIFSDFIEVIITHIDHHAPLKKVSRKQLKLKLKPWITTGLLTSIKHKQKLYKSHFLHGDTEQIKIYKKYANKLNKVKFLSKQLYFENQLNSFQGNAYCTWKVIKSLLSSPQKNSIPEIIKQDGDVITDPKVITQKFCEYFSSIGSNLASKISSHSNFDYKHYLRNRVSSSLFFQPTSPAEVMQQMYSLNIKKSCGYDGISAYFLQSAASVLATPLSLLYNYSFEFGLFPDCLKIAKVLPIFKGGDNAEIGNYRPISILPLLSKLLEKLICSRTSNFLDKHSVIIPTQYGFRHSHCTSHAMLDILTSTYDNINNNEHTALLFLDLKKAFDTVDHRILLEKLKHYGIRGIAHDMYASFLTNRQQYVSLNNIQSNKMFVNCGVPQGSVLGPLLFSIYINDISNCTTYNPRLFADDTCLILKHENINKLISFTNKEIDVVNNWLLANKLTLNNSKSGMLLLKHKTNNSILLSNVHTKLPVFDNTKYLGVTFDSSLSFDCHITKLIKKLSRSVGILSKVKPFLNRNALLHLYYAIFHSHLTYGLITWGLTFKTQLNKLINLQNKAVKIIGGGNYYDKATPFYSKLKILKLPDLIKFEIALFVHKVKIEAVPSQFSEYLPKVKNLHNIPTRANLNDHYFLPFLRSKKLQRSIKYQGPKIWNSLDPQIRKCNSTKSFKAKLKKSFLSNYLK